MTKSLIDKVKSEIQRHRKEIVNVTSNLIRFPTISPPSETRECAEYIKSYFDEIGLDTSFHEKQKNKTNVQVKVPGKPGRTIIWLGHLDVVPAGLTSKWMHEPFKGESDNERVYGRGASDMKGSCAAAMVAAKILTQIPMDERAGVDFWFTCDEEIGAPDGTRWLVQTGLLKGDACLIGDSLYGSEGDLWIDAGCKGYLRVKLRAVGKTAHGSMPFYGDNAIEKLIKAVTRAMEIGNFTLDLPPDLKPLISSSIEYLLEDNKMNKLQRIAILRAFDFPTISLNLINGGVKVNVVPDEAEATFDIRITPGTGNSKVEEGLVKLFEDHENKDVKVEIIESVNGYYESTDSLFMNALSESVKYASGQKPLTKLLMGATDAIAVKEKISIPCLGFGAGIEGLAHAPNEYVKIQSLVTAAKVYSILPLVYDS